MRKNKLFKICGLISIGNYAQTTTAHSQRGHPGAYRKWPKLVRVVAGKKLTYFSVPLHVQPTPNNGFFCQRRFDSRIGQVFAFLLSTAASSTCMLGQTQWLEWYEAVFHGENTSAKSPAKIDRSAQVQVSQRPLRVARRYLQRRSTVIRRCCHTGEGHVGGRVGDCRPADRIRVIIRKLRAIWAIKQ